MFIAATNDKRFRSFDSKSGKELWSAKLDMNAHAVPITYQGKNGKQYVAIVAGGAAPWMIPSLRARKPWWFSHYRLPDDSCVVSQKCLYVSDQH